MRRETAPFLSRPPHPERCRHGTPEVWPLWTSDARPGREHPIGLADPGHEYPGGIVRAPVKRAEGKRPADDGKPCDRLIHSIRGITERADALRIARRPSCRSSRARPRHLKITQSDQMSPRMVHYLLRL